MSTLLELSKEVPQNVWYLSTQVKFRLVGVGSGSAAQPGFHHVPV